MEDSFDIGIFHKLEKFVGYDIKVKQRETESKAIICNLM